MSHVRRARASAPGRRAVAGAVSLALALGLLATPLGAVAAPSPSATPTAAAPTDETAAPAPDDTATPAPDDTATPAPHDPAASQPTATTEPTATPDDDAVAPTDDSADGAEEPPPGEASTDGDEQSEAVLPEARASPQARAAIGILAAGIPNAPTQAWIETFEQGLTTTAASGLSTYASGRYSATSTAWTTGANCTGVLVNYTAAYPNAAFCPSEPILGGAGGQSTLNAREVRRMADVLGQVSAGVTGSTSSTAPAVASTDATRTNHALVSAPTATIGAGNANVLRSTAGIGVSAPASRYYTLSLDLAGDECANNPASLTPTLLVGTTTFAPFASPIVPCTNAAATYYASTPALAATGGGLDGTTALNASVRAGTFTGATPVLMTPAQISAAQINIANSVTSPTGNAFAIDNIRVLDASPALDMAFNPTPATATVPTTLTYTITNSNDLFAKTDWGFSTALPAGLVVAPGSAVGGTCANVTGTAFAVTAAAGSSSITAVGGDLAASATSCTITVSVVAAAAGTYTSGTVAPTGLIVSPAASLTVNPASTLTVRKIITSRAAAGDQFTLSVRSGTTVLAAATTTGSAVGLQSAQVVQVVQPGATYTIHEQAAAGAGLNYAASYECLRGTTVIAAGSNPAGSLTMPADAGAEIVCTFTNTPQAVRLACNPTQFYAVNQAGALSQVDIVTGAMTSIGSWTAANANGLGIGVNGSIAYALERSSSDAGNIASMLKWTPSAGFQTIANSAYTTVAGGATVTGALVAGTVDLANNRYLFGKFSGGSFYIWSYTEATNAYAFVGSFATGSGPNGNGDMSFDSRGNLYVVGSATVGTANSAAIYTVPASALASANGTTLAVSASTTKPLSGTDASPVLGAVNGIAFSPRGTAYLSSSTGVYEFDPTTWARFPGSASVPPTGTTTDLSSCSSPSTVTVLKNVVGRAAAADQFDLTLASGGSTVATATTTGVAVGRQAAQIGPHPAPLGTTLTISEAMAAGSSSLIGVYTSVYECWLDGVRIATATATSGTVTMPNQLNANVVCTFFNSPRPASTVTVTKQVLNPATGTPAAAAGWTLTTTAAATTGTATVLPSESQRQVTGAAGSATWAVLFGSTASRATLTIAEEQQTGFVFSSATCTVNGAAVAVTFTTSGGVVSGSIPGVASASTVACTIVNRPVASLSLVKNVSFGSARPTDWTLSATGPAGALPGPSGRSGTSAATSIPVTPGVAYRLAEAGGALTYVQSGTWQCRTATGAVVAVTAAGDVTLAQGANVTCTVTNATATLTLVKQVQNPQPGFQAADWTLSATPAAFAGGALPTQTRPGAEYAAGGNAASTFEVRPGHTYTLDEVPTTAGSRLAYQTLRLERLDGSSWTPVSSTTIAAPAAGQNAVYRFVNAPVRPTALPLTGGMSTDAFLLGGGALLALTLSFAFLYRWRRTRRGLL